MPDGHVPMMPHLTLWEKCCSLQRLIFRMHLSSVYPLTRERKLFDLCIPSMENLNHGIWWKFDFKKCHGATLVCKNTYIGTELSEVSGVFSVIIILVA